jgi:hypothetical protein
MSDQPPFVPPGAPPPPPAAVPASTPAAATGAPTLPPPAGAPRLGSEPPTATGRPPRRTLRIALIAGAGLLVAALLVGATVLAFSVLDDLLGTGSGAPAEADDGNGDSDPGAEPDQPAPGEDGDDPGAGDSGQTPVAVTPLDCDACFGAYHVGETIPADALLEDLGLSIPFGSWGDYPPYLAGAELDFQVAAWVRDSGSDDACFFTYPATPVGPTAAGVGSPDDAIEYLGSFTDTKSINSVAQSLRIFSSSASASAYLTALDDAIPECDSYRLASGWEPTVAPTPRFSLPDDVAAVGFVESMGPDALHVVNLQRGNLIVHVTLWTGRGGPTATDFRAYVEGLAVQLSEIQPRS